MQLCTSRLDHSYLILIRDWGNFWSIFHLLCLGLTVVARYYRIASVCGCVVATSRLLACKEDHTFFCWFYYTGCIVYFQDLWWPNDFKRKKHRGDPVKYNIIISFNFFLFHVTKINVLRTEKWFDRKLVTLFSFYENNFIRTSRLKFCLKFFPKTMKNSEFGHGNFPNEGLDREKHFKHVFGVGVGWEFENI